MSILALMFVLASMLVGFAFTLGSHDKSYSMTMASAYISGFSIYFIVMYQIGKKAGTESVPTAPSCDLK